MDECKTLLIGMKPPARDDAVDPVLRERRNMERRKMVQAGAYTPPLFSST